MDPVERLLAIEEIRQLKSRYFRFMDRKDWGGLATVFTDDAIFDARTANSVSSHADEGAGAASNDWLYEGGATILAFIREVVTPLVTVHHGHGHEVELLSETEARGIIAMEDMIWHGTGSPDTLVLHGYGHYEEEYRKTGGQWRIRRSRLTRLNVILGE